ncbi:hypothetical protein vBVpaMR16F_251 [Vibrio phage vB_VpaM_R16F]|nr:hypothetical protein vBVpaMR16F_251 [Vibrio phage vB_VpaM_R16F]
MITCKHKNIYHEIKKRLPSVDVSLDYSCQSMIYLQWETINITDQARVVQVCEDVLRALGYIQTEGSDTQCQHP